MSTLAAYKHSQMCAYKHTEMAHTELPTSNQTESNGIDSAQRAVGVSAVTQCACSLFSAAHSVTGG